jgi:ribosomal-protein-alanine N-acetyltransferase
MTLDDLPDVMRIEKEAFTSVWPQTLYRRELQHNDLARYLVLEQLGDVADAPAAGGFRDQLRRLWGGSDSEQREAVSIVGFVGVWFMAGEGHIVTIAVDPRYRRLGLGELLLLAIIDVSMAHGQEAMSLECRVSNTAAQALYEKYGFHRTGVRPRYYSDNHEDALIMTTEAVNTAAYQARLSDLRRIYDDRWGGHRRAADVLD